MRKPKPLVFLDCCMQTWKKLFSSPLETRMVSIRPVDINIATAGFTETKSRFKRCVSFMLYPESTEELTLQIFKYLPD